jgi:sarcosine oxidase/L-pipecolate oxidase
LSEEKMKTWGWRPGHGDPEGSGRKGPPPKDLKDVPGWAHGDPVEDE